MHTYKIINAVISGSAVEYLKQTPQVTYWLEKDGDKVEQTFRTEKFVGKLAEEWGLADQPVTLEVMELLADGFAPDGTPLCQNAGAKPTLVQKVDKKTKELVFDDNGEPVMVEEGGRRQGIDFTFSPPKSVSLAFAIGDDRMRQLILECQERAVDLADKWMMEQIAETRRGHEGIDVIGMDAMIASRHLQIDSRNGDPHIHSHGFYYNIGRGNDKRFGTWAADELIRWQHTMDIIYQNELAHGLRQGGLSIHQEVDINIHNEQTGIRTWEIAGLHDRELIEAVSTRHTEIAEAKAQGLDDLDAWGVTRKNKKDQTYAETLTAFDALKADLSKKFHIPTMDELRNQVDVQHPVNERGELLEFLHMNESIFDTPTLLKQLGMEHLGFVSGAELQAKFEEFITDKNDLVQVKAVELHEDDRGQHLARKHRETRFASVKIVEEEIGLIAGSVMRENDDHLKLPRHIVEEQLAKFEEQAGFKLSEQQRNAAFHKMCNTGGVAIVEGAAGVGKTVGMKVDSMAYEACGYTMLGCAIANKAAKQLEKDSGMKSVSVAQMISDLNKADRRGKQILTDKHVVVVDEAGMIDTQSIYRLSQYCAKAGAKLILTGDTSQIQPVGAGSGLGLLQLGLEKASLTEIRRQKDEEMRKMAMAYYDLEKDGTIKKKEVKSRRQVKDKGRMLYDMLDERGCLDEYRTREEAVSALVRKYMSSEKGVEDKLIVAHTNADLIMLNQAIRHELKKDGEISTEDITVQAMGRNNFFNLMVSEGDRIRFTAKDSVMDVVNGTEATIDRIKPNQKRGGYDITVTIDETDPVTMIQDFRQLTFNTHEWKAIQLNYAMTVHGAQGQGKKDIFHLLNTSMADNQSMLVAFTRLTDGEYTLFGTSQEFERLEERLGLDRIKENVLTTGLVDPVFFNVEEELKKIREKKHDSDFDQKVQEALNITHKPLQTDIKRDSVQHTKKRNLGLVQ